MLSQEGFNLWAEGYDQAVHLSDESSTYPFAGYKDILNRIFGRVLEKDHAVILDVGFGTGTLTAKLYERGCEVWGQDFSEKMIQLAQPKMPRARLFQGDFSQGLAAQLLQNRYDFIIATYSLHHLDLDGKVRLLQTMRTLLAAGGKILIGDVAFETAAELEQCRQECGDEWDDDEIYFVFDEIKTAFPNAIFEKISYCSGIITITN